MTSCISTSAPISFWCLEHPEEQTKYFGPKESYFLKIIFLEGKQLPEQLGLPQKALTCGAIVSPVKKQIFCSCQEKENKMLWNIKIINKIISTLH